MFSLYADFFGKCRSIFLVIDDDIDFISCGTTMADLLHRLQAPILR